MDSREDRQSLQSRSSVSADGYARFEERAKGRRVQNRLVAARAAIARRRLDEAVSAVDEIRDLAPTLAELPALVGELERARLSRRTTGRGRWAMAAVVFAGLILSASSLLELPPPRSSEPAAIPAVSSVIPPKAEPRPPMIGRPDVVADVPKVTSVPEGPRAVDTSIERPARIETRRAGESVPSVVSSEAANVLPVPEASVPPSVEPIPLKPDPIGLKPVSTGNETLTVDDQQLVHETLRRYRGAYGDLDVNAARAVWPNVNAEALARAFDGLASQSLTFQSCDVQVDGDAATAACRGATQYVPKVGSREPRTEPRRWSFSLKKRGIEWKIENARTER